MSTRLAFVVLILAGIGACGSNGDTNSNTCGDGTKAGAEQCDDGNTTSGDGCSSICTNEVPDGCGDGVVFVATEQCDDGNNVDGDGCSATCRDECGNGMLNGAEMCDDGNTINGDGCTACAIDPLYTCTGAPSHCVKPTGACNDPFTVVLANNGGTLQGSGSGDTTGGMNQVPMGTCDSWSHSGDAADHVWKLVLPDQRDVKITIDTSTPFDAVLRLTSTPCSAASEVIEHLGQDGCSDSGVEGEGEELFYSKLPAGTYYILIDGYDSAAVGTYSFTVTATTTTCGNGVHEAPEQCDDGAAATGDGCNDRCDVEPGYACDNSAAPSVCAVACGNGHLDAGEECDDANVVSGDRCSATCALESDIAEVEPNDTTAQVVSASNHRIRGAMPDGDVDLYTFTLAVPSTVEIETYDTMDPDEIYSGVSSLTNVDCFSADTVVHVFGAAGDPTDNTTELYNDDEDGASSCSYAGPNDSANDDSNDTADPTQGVLPAGTYTIKIENYFDGAFPIDRYILDIKITSTTPTAPVAGDLVMNEFMAADNASDTNCDGSTTDTVDEFVELVNNSNKVLDLTGVTISDSMTVRATLNTSATHGASSSLTLQPGKAVVVWGGGAPACAGVTNWFLAGTTQLGLNDAGDTITVKNAATATLLSYTFGAQTANKSMNLSPDVSGSTYVLHDTVPGHVGAFSPGKRSDATAF